MSDVYTRRFSELAARLDALLASKKQEYDEFLSRSKMEIDGNALLEWKVKARSLISHACGPESEHLKAFSENEDTSFYGSRLGTLEALRAVFLAAREDYEGGYLKSVRGLVQAEVFGSELDQARALRESGYIAAAAVIAGVVLETCLRSLCAAAAVPEGKLEKMNADLVKVGTYNVLVQKRVTALAAIRNSAAHGKTGEFTAADVASMIEEVERFVASHV
jgi:hypothetical protein